MRKTKRPKESVRRHKKESREVVETSDIPSQIERS